MFELISPTPVFGAKAPHYLCGPDASLLEGLESLTYTRYRTLLQPDLPSVRFWCACADSQPIALVLGQAEPHYRRQGIALTLLQRLETTVQREFPRCTQQTALYTARNDNLPALKKLLARAGWSAPRDTAFIGLMSIERLREKSLWIHQKIPPLSANMRFVAWDEVDESLHARVREMLDSGEAPHGLDPDLYRAQRVDSIGGVIVDSGQVAGWIAHRCAEATPGVLRYGSLYTRERYRMRGLSMRLWYLTLGRHMAREAKRFPTMMVDIAVEHRAHLATFHRRYAPYFDRVFSARCSEKAL